MKEDFRKKRFYEAYGKHILLIEIALILTLTFAVDIQTFFPTPIIPFTAGVWWIALFVSALIHLRFYFKIAKMELCPYKILRLGCFRYRFLITAFISFFLSFTLVLPVSIFSTEIPSEIYDILMQISNIALLVAFPMFMIGFTLWVGSITDHKKARLSFKTVLNAMELLRKKTNTNEKTKLIEKYVKWFRVGLRSYNSYLHESKPTSLEIVNIKEYHRSLCNVALMGKQAEIDNTIEQVKSALNSMGRREKEDDLRNFLIALKNMKSMKMEKDYPLSELNEMTRILPFSERVKEWLRSPYITSLVVIILSIIAIVVQVLPILLRGQ